MDQVDESTRLETILHSAPTSKKLETRKMLTTVFPVIVAAGLNFSFEMDFSQPAQPTAHTKLPVRVQLKGGYYHRAVTITGNTVTQVNSTCNLYNLKLDEF